MAPAPASASMAAAAPAVQNVAVDPAQESAGESRPDSQNRAPNPQHPQGVQPASEAQGSRPADAAVATLPRAESSSPSFQASPIAFVHVTAPLRMSELSVAYTPPMAPVAVRLPDDGEMRQQIVQNIRLQWQDGAGDARFTLKPEYLGGVTVSLRIEHGSVSAHVSAETPEVRAWMQAHEPSLREGLAEHGLSLERLVVDEHAPEAQPDRPAGQGRRRAPQAPPPPARTPRRTREPASFEILV